MYDYDTSHRNSYSDSNNHDQVLTTPKKPNHVTYQSLKSEL